MVANSTAAEDGSVGLVNGSVTTVSISSLPAGITFTLRLSTEGDDGWSSKSEPMMIMTADSADSLRYKALLRQAATDHKVQPLPLGLGVGLGALLVAVLAAAYHWHHHGSILPWRSYRATRTRAAMRKSHVSSTEIQAIIKNDAAAANGRASGGGRRAPAGASDSAA
jgi:hypothetical protein